MAHPIYPLQPNAPLLDVNLTRYTKQAGSFISGSPAPRACTKGTTNPSPHRKTALDRQSKRGAVPTLHGNIPRQPLTSHAVSRKGRTTPTRPPGHKPHHEAPVPAGVRARAGRGAGSERGRVPVSVRARQRGGPRCRAARRQADSAPAVGSPGHPTPCRPLVYSSLPRDLICPHYRRRRPDPHAHPHIPIVISSIDRVTGSC